MTLLKNTPKSGMKIYADFVETLYGISWLFLFIQILNLKLWAINWFTGGRKLDNGFTDDSMLDLYIYETTQNIEQLEQAVLFNEKASGYTPDTINEIFRIMHTIKGSSGMMMYHNITMASHAMEDLFYYIREGKPDGLNYSALSDLVLECIDFIKVELEKIKASDDPDGDPSGLIASVNGFLSEIKGCKDSQESSEKMAEPAKPSQCVHPMCNENGASARICYEAVIWFEKDCEMENVRAFAIIHVINDIASDIRYFPEDIIENPASVNVIREQGFRLVLKTEKNPQELHDIFLNTAFVRDLELKELTESQISDEFHAAQTIDTVSAVSDQKRPDSKPNENRNTQSIISVDVEKLDKLMDLMGEMVIAEAMVTQNPELKAIRLNSFYKAARQLRKITGEMQDMVMAIRMVPLATTFHKMSRIVRDMSRKLGKEIELKLIGEETKVDKNIIEHISDPLMHLVRNSVDHGIEIPDVRAANGKPRTGRIILEAANIGGDVFITIRDDGKGLNKEKILRKAVERGLIHRPVNEMTDKEIYNLIFLPGFSTNDSVTEYSGRGVGMDVVMKNLEAVGGSMSIDSTEGAGMIATLKIPLTLAIIDGMNICVGNAKYTLPTASIQRTFRANARDIITDLDGNEMILVRGECYPVLRLHKLFSLETTVTDLTKGIMLVIEQDDKKKCLFADELLGQHQVVVKALPDYMKSIRKVESLAGCTLLGDGSISLILNMGGLINL